MTTERVSSALVAEGFLALLFTGAGPEARQAGADPAGWVGTWTVYIGVGTSGSLFGDASNHQSRELHRGRHLDQRRLRQSHALTPLGVWVKTGHNRFAVTFVELLSDAQAALVGRNKAARSSMAVAAVRLSNTP